MNPELEELRRRAYIYVGQEEGLKGFDRIAVKSGINLENPTDEELKHLKLEIMKEVFVKRFGLEKTREMMAKKVTHVPGYVPFQDRGELTRTGRTKSGNAMKYIALFVFIIMGVVLAYFYLYAKNFDEYEMCMSKQGQDRGLCLQNLAIREKKVEICNPIEDKIQKSKCLATLGSMTGNVSVCQQVLKTTEYGSTYELCVTCVAKIRKNESICDLMTEELRIYYCKEKVRRRQQLEICPH